MDAQPNPHRAPSPAPAFAQRRVSRAFAYLCRALAVLLPALVAWSVFARPIEALLPPLGSGAGADTEAWQRLLVRVLALLPVSGAAYGLWRAADCLGALARGEYFSERAARGLEGLGAGMLVAGVAGLLVAPLAGLIATWNAAPGMHALALSLDSNVIMTLLFGAIVRQIASVLRRAIALAAENAQFV
jgi:hypothetical protein